MKHGQRAARQDPGKRLRNLGSIHCSDEKRGSNSPVGKTCRRAVAKFVGVYMRLATSSQFTRSFRKFSR